MGKKKRSGGGRKSKGRAASKDWSSHTGDGQDLLSEELTALSAIFQDDFRVVAESPHTQFSVTLRPHSSDTGYDDPNVQALLLVRCLPGYPFKCPKLKILPEKGLTQSDADRLLYLLNDQANFNAREGRVMIFNLVEAAQEFLSEILPVQESHESVSPCVSGRREQWSDTDAAYLCDRISPCDGTFVYGSFDLYRDMSCESGSWDQALATDFVNHDRRRITSEKTSVNDKIRQKNIDKSKQYDAQADPFQNFKAGLLHDMNHGKVTPTDLHIVPVEIDDDSRSFSANSPEFELVGKGSKDVNNEDSAEKDLTLVEQMAKMGIWENVSVPLMPPLEEMVHGDKPENMKRDLLLVHLLRICSSTKGSLPYSLTEIASELCNLGILSEWAKDLAAKAPVFDKAFENVFQQYMISSPISQFWKASTDFNSDNAPVLKSRYLNDFEEVCPLGHGGFGHVVLCKNKLDGRQYAVKKIRLKDKNLSINDKILSSSGK